MSRYLVVTLRTPAFDPALVGAHYTFLDRLRQAGQLKLAGPFFDHSGGAYLLHAETLTKATEIAHGDPLHQSGSSRITVHEWETR